MRAYSDASLECLRARDLLKDWAGEGFLTDAQYQRLREETVCDLRRTNIFLRIVLFLFTVIIVAAVTGLFALSFLAHPDTKVVGFFLFIFGALSYAGAEAAARNAKLYRYGIEEALAVCSVAFLCGGVAAMFERSGRVELFIAAAGAVLSLWIWHRFGLVYAFFAAMVFVLWIPLYWTPSYAAQHAMAAAFYLAGLIMVIRVRRRRSLTYLNDGYSIVEALLWFGIYAVINLHLPPANLTKHWWRNPSGSADFSAPFYWTTWVLTWCLPPLVLARGLRSKDRVVSAAGAVMMILTLVTNKPYLGWERHTWDPMLLGILLIGIALLIRRWLASGRDGIRHGFTARRLSAKDKQWMSAGATAFAVISPQPLTPAAQGNADVHFGGGDSGGGGATSDF